MPRPQSGLLKTAGEKPHPSPNIRNQGGNLDRLSLAYCLCGHISCLTHGWGGSVQISTALRTRRTHPSLVATAAACQESPFPFSGKEHAHDFTSHSGPSYIVYPLVFPFFVLMLFSRFLRRSSCVAQTASHSHDPSRSSQLLNYAPDLVRAFSHRAKSLLPDARPGTGC
jgi:hypothetical protein